jgi:DNA-binding NtrC family response regulator
MAAERVMIVDDEESIREWLSIALRKQGYEIDCAQNGEEALRLFKQDKYDAIITDIKMPKVDGLELLREIKSIDPSASVIMTTAFGSMESAIEALRGGASDYITKPFKIEEVKLRLEKIVESERLRRENVYLKTELKKREEERKIIGDSPALEAVLTMVERVAKSESTVMILGESGTGKELIAREIHNRSPRADRPFVTINCGALPETLLESELFGHKKGSFTGAIKDKLGLFQVADKGTFFLDEVGETSPGIQVKLLRVLQEKEIVQIGGTSPIKVDVRVIAATNEDLDEKMRAGDFRKDLFYRLNVIPLRIPSLKERREDIPLLVDYFLDKYCAKMGIALKKISSSAMQVLMQYAWPGNVRELENAIERAIVLQEGDTVKIGDLPERMLQEPPRQVFGSLREKEREAIISALEEAGGNATRAAKNLGIHPSTLYRKLKKYDLEEK